MKANNNELISTADEFRRGMPKYNSMVIKELLKMPKFFDLVDCKVDDDLYFNMYLAGGDDGVALRFYWNGSYERFTLRLWSLFSKISEVIIDVGAHTGAYTLTAMAANRSARVISFEPHFMNFARLNLNIRANGFNPSNINMLGVGEKAAVVPFSISTNISYLSTGGAIGERKNAIINNINIVALDQFIPSSISEKINLIKIDVEGHEHLCLLGMLDIIKYSRPIIFFECIDRKSGFEVENILKKLNYNFFIVDEISNELIEVYCVEPEFNDSGMLLMNRLNRIACPIEYDLKEAIQI